MSSKFLETHEGILHAHVTMEQLFRHGEVSCPHMRLLIPLLILSAALNSDRAAAHEGGVDISLLDGSQREALRQHLLDEWKQRNAAMGSLPVELAAQEGTPPLAGKAPEQATAFQSFMPRVKVRWDDTWLHIESNGMPAHPMMTGIINWQQQVPIPQDYHGLNAWRIPLQPVPAKTPLPVRDRFLRGAIAIAVNGIPIFNPQNNRGEISAEIGELDRWGGHCGRADDYHYHAAPLHLQEAAGKGRPIAFALDGYPILGLTEASGSEPLALDTFHGHEHGSAGYHYHASTKMPYVNGGFHGEVVERDGQVDPQPRAQPVRPALPPLRGAKITDFTTVAADHYKLTYELNGRDGNTVSYQLTKDGTVEFEFRSALGESRNETHQRREPRENKKGSPRRR
jgi:hypothetical protein